MKYPIRAVVAATVLLSAASCEKRDSELQQKVNQLEKQAAESTERQRQLEAELSAQKIAVEQEAIERERTLLERERQQMAEQQNSQNAAATADFEKRNGELAAREAKVATQLNGLEAEREKLTGLESSLRGRELEVAGREPVNSLRPPRPPVSGSPTADYSSFYEPLGAYGSWFDTREFGYVYQPTVVRDVSWRPYTRGRWAFTDQGWTWVSSEAFGWACYHYGRWALLRNVGWIWVPGNEWAPSWVTWRESSSHIGWAPLPPETLAWRGRAWDSSVEDTFGIGMNSFSFVQYRYFGNDIQHYCIPASRNVTVYRQTVNITHYQVNNQQVFVGGPRYQSVCSSIGRPFPVHHLHVNQGPYIGRSGGNYQSRFSGNELFVVAPCMQAGWNQALQPSVVSSRLDHVSVDRSHELPGEILQHFQASRLQETVQAQQIVSAAGGPANFEQIRLRQLETARIEVQKEAKLVESMPAPIPAVPVATARKINSPADPVVPVEKAPVVANPDTTRAPALLPPPGNVAAIEGESLPTITPPAPAMAALPEPSTGLATVPAETITPGGSSNPVSDPAPGVSIMPGALTSLAPAISEPAMTSAIPGGTQIDSPDSPIPIPPQSEAGLAQDGPMPKQEILSPPVVPLVNQPAEMPQQESATAPAREQPMNQLDEQDQRIEALRQQQVRQPLMEQQEAATRLAREEQMNQLKDQAQRIEALRQQHPQQTLMPQQETATRLAEEEQANQLKEQAQRIEALRQQQAQQSEMSQQEAGTRLAREEQANQLKEQAQRIEAMRQQQAQQSEMSQQEAATRLAQEAQMNLLKEQAQREAAMSQQQESAQREAAVRQQQEQAQREAAMREQQEQAQRETAMRQQQEQAQREAAMRQQQEQAQREAAMRQQQEQAQREAAMRQQQEQAQREEAMRRQQEQAQREEAMRRQQEEAQRQEAIRRQQEEAQRQQQEEMRRQQEQAQREEAIRRQQEGAQRE